MSARQELLDWVDQSFGDFTVGKPHQVVEQIKEIMWQIELRNVERIGYLEHELAEVRRDADRYRFLRNNPPTHMSVRRFPGETERGCYLDGANLDWEIDLRIDAASVAQANKEQGND